MSALSEMEALTPMEALTMATGKLGTRLHVIAGERIIESYRASMSSVPIAVPLPDKADYHFHITQVPYRRDKDHALIHPMIDDRFNPAWVNAPEEYVQFYSGGSLLLIPVLRPAVEAVI